MDEANKYIDCVGIHPYTIVVAGMKDGGADVARKGVGMGEWWCGGGCPWVRTGCV